MSGPESAMNCPGRLALLAYTKAVIQVRSRMRRVFILLLEVGPCL